jgi:hypothetical protein
MMQNTAYRLAEFKIIENTHGDLWWETHIGLGSLKTGKGFINGDILFLVPSDITGPGFLKGEFLDHLNRLSKWKKTKYYCASYKISECQSVSQIPLAEEKGRRLRNEVGHQRHGTARKAVAKTSLKSDNTGAKDHIRYKLSRYEITEMKNGQLVWKSPGGLGSLKKGCCHIRGNILFLEAGETELSKLTNKEFLQKLKGLPDWKRTKCFCPSCTIYYCNTGAICRSLVEDRALNRTVTQNFVDNRKANGVGISPRPIIVDKGGPRENLKAFFDLLKLSAILILKLLCGSVRIADMILRNWIDRWLRFRGY